jgi:hypothetical protein
LKKKEDREKTGIASVAATLTGPVQLGPDPSLDLRLSVQAKQAIQYAQIYSKDKSLWKFNKAKQNWLLRNALSIPPSDYDASLARRQASTTETEGDMTLPDGENTEENAEKLNDDGEEGETFIPDDFVAVVTAYLQSVQGGSRQRLVGSLNEALKAPEVAVKPEPAAAPEAVTQVNANVDNVATTPANGTKSVSFAKMAMEAEAEAEEIRESAGSSAVPDTRTVELRRDRARRMLQQMGEFI